MNIMDVKKFDVLNGEGIRVSIFVSGCNHHCEGCFNKISWNHKNGEEFTDEIQEEILRYFEKNKSISGLSLLGGDPTFHLNIQPLLDFLKKFKERIGKTVWMWTGYTYEELKSDSMRFKLFSECDVVIDGKFNEDLKDLNLRWKGSTNQNVIDVKKTLDKGEIVLYK